MSSPGSHSGSLSTWTWVAPVAAALFLGLLAVGVLSVGSVWVIVLAALLLAGSVFASVQHAEMVALRVGEPFGSIILAASVTVIEVSLIVSLMLSSPEGGTEIARDTVFSAVMIVLNGVVGLCLLVGGIRHHQQEFQIRGAVGSLGVIGTLATLALILPNYTLSVPGPIFSQAQLVFVGVVSLALYGLFLFVQTVRHREDFLDAEGSHGAHAKPDGRTTLLSGGLLLLSLVTVVLLAEDLSHPVEEGIASLGLPLSFVGVVIAAVVLLPEGLSAIAAARANRLQTSLNLALGSAMASIGLTIPTVVAVSLFMGTPLSLGLDPEHIVILVLTLFMCTLSFGAGRTTVLQGGVHLVIFGAFLVIAAVP
ncbi:calcium:proton antiporter [Pseudoruegeria sp. SK021]|uniref:calcium:proton antiporter n=1 Tax=Pseudoruegeria sp. SK021 TaxID=1933035 RepID=UPI000A25879F|nr:ionic transporter y4hA [Pseudoruegeria sp. SK021]OSP55505.1 ionic transporter y4hA [Pseudoruegeria sp. SK021]